MTHKRYSVLFPLLALAALALIVAPSVLTPGKLLCNAMDARYFLIRLREFTSSWMGADRSIGRWAPRWL